MRTCIICGETKEDTEFNLEHVILESLGGKGNEDLIRDLCTDCNSKLGSTIDSRFTNHTYIQYLRNQFMIKGKNNIIPNPYQNIEIDYGNMGIKGYLKTNSKTGKVNGIRAKHDVQYLEDGRILVTGPRKGFAKFARSKLLAEGYDYSEGEIEQNKADFPQLVPSDITIAIPDDKQADFLKQCFYPLALKMAFEYCYKELGKQYLQDPIATGIVIPTLKNYIDSDVSEFHSVECQLVLDSSRNRTVHLSIKQVENKIQVMVDIYGEMKANLCMSEQADLYDLNNIRELRTS